MPETYGEVFAEMIDRRAKHEERSDIFRKLDISKNQFYNVTNPNRTTAAGNTYPFPTEWGVRTTNDFQDYEWIKLVSRDCGGLFISPEDMKELETSDPEAALKLFQKIVGMVKNK